MLRVMITGIHAEQIPQHPVQAGRVMARDTGERMRVLLADDCRHGRRLLTGLLLKWGIVPTLAGNGEQAVLLTQRRNFDLVIMDILLPGMDGVVATAKIRQFERENLLERPVPIVAYSALDLGAVKAPLEHAGVTAVLYKPCSSSSLQNCLAFCCPGRRFLS
jgi:CheY-like chemotaxis protein